MKLFAAVVDQRIRYCRLNGIQTEISKANSLIDAVTSDDFVAFDGDATPVLCVAPSKIVCVGRNYAEHAKELGNELPSEPLLFLKAPSALIADGDPIKLPTQSAQVEHEGELAIIIGREAFEISDEDDIYEYILGYSCLNDVTARDLQKADGQFARAKSFNSFCPIGPYIETELDPSDIGISVRVNGETRQTGRTSMMIFDIPDLLRYISRQMTLLPGDVIATGTPSGVSKMNSGDICEVDIEGVGILRNPVTN